MTFRPICRKNRICWRTILGNLSRTRRYDYCIIWLWSVIELEVLF